MPKKILSGLFIFILIILSSCSKPAYLEDIQNTADFTDKPEVQTEDNNRQIAAEPRPARELSLDFTGKNYYAINSSPYADGACVIDGVLYYASNGVIYYIDSKTGFAELLCKDPLCRHFYATTRCLSDNTEMYVRMIVSDGKKMFAYGEDVSELPKSTSGIYEIDLKNQKKKKLISWNNYSGRFNPTLQAQDNYIYYSKRDGEEDYNNLYRINIASGKSEKLNSKNTSFQQYKIVGDKIYYRGLDDILYKSDFTMQNPEIIAVDMQYLEIIDDKIYFAAGEYVEFSGNFKDNNNSGIKYKVSYKELDDNSEENFCFYTSNGMPLFVGDKYYYLPYEPVITETYEKNGKKYDLMNQSNGKIVTADLNTNEILSTYQNTQYFNLAVYYADENCALIRTTSKEQNEYSAYIVEFSDNHAEYYYSYEVKHAEEKLY